MTDVPINQASDTGPSRLAPVEVRAGAASAGRRIVGRLVIPPKRYKVGELVAATGLSRQTLHNYTKWGLIDEASWTEGGHRLYDESVFARLEQVMRLKATRTVQEVRALLEREAEQVRQAQEDAA